MGLRKSKIITVAGFDLGTHYGYSKFKVSENYIKLCDHGVWHYKVCDVYGGGWRFVDCENTLNAYLDDVDLVAYENVEFIKFTKAAQLWGSYRGILHGVCTKMAIPYNGYGVTSVKKLVTGKGNSGKNIMIDSVNKLFDIKITDDNAADAIAIAYTMIKGLTWENGHKQNISSYALRTDTPDQ